jgi:hypothetical protein
VAFNALPAQTSACAATSHGVLPKGEGKAKDEIASTFDLKVPWHVSHSVQ